MQSDPTYPPILFFYQGSTSDGSAFFEKLWPDARAISDTPLTFYNAFGIERGGMKEMFGGGVWACGIRATLKGQRIGLPVGDPWIMPGAFLVDDTGRVAWQHDFAHAGDHPDWAAIPMGATA